MQQLDQNQIEEIVKLILVQQQDKSDKAASKTVSELFHQLDNKLDSHIQKHEEDFAKLKPILSAFQKASGAKAVLFLLAATIASILAIIEGWRRLLKI